MRYSVIHDGSCGPGLSTGLVWRSKEGWASCRFHVPFQRHPRLETMLLVAARHDSNLHFSWPSWKKETWQCLSLEAYPTPWEPWTGGPAFPWTEVGRTVFFGSWKHTGLTSTRRCGPVCKVQLNLISLSLKNYMRVFWDSRSSFHQKVIAFIYKLLKQPVCRRFGAVKHLECSLMMCPTKMKSKTLLICSCRFVVCSIFPWCQKH